METKNYFKYQIYYPDHEDSDSLGYVHCSDKETLKRLELEKLSPKGFKIKEIIFVPKNNAK